MAEQSTSRDIDLTASKWTARLDRGPLTPEEARAFRAWLDSDPRSKGALLRAQAMSLMSESAVALGPNFDPAAFEAPRSPRFSRRSALAWAGGGVAAVGLAALGFALPAAAGVISTARGEIRLAPLPDGSTVLLNTDSSIRVRYGEDGRKVALLRGEAFFSVARDEKRPFIVEVDGRRLRAIQAGFRVRQLGRAPVELLVSQGQVDVVAKGRSDLEGGVAVMANTRLTLGDPMVGGAVERPQAVAPEAVSRELAWREGKLAFEGETLEQAAQVFARYSGARIHVRDPALAREPVTGLFAANDPAGFSRAIARLFDARLEREGDDIVLTRPAHAE